MGDIRCAFRDDVTFFGHFPKVHPDEVSMIEWMRERTKLTLPLLEYRMHEIENLNWSSMLGGAMVIVDIASSKVELVFAGKMTVV